MICDLKCDTCGCTWTRIRHHRKCPRHDFTARHVWVRRHY